MHRNPTVAEAVQPGVTFRANERRWKIRSHFNGAMWLCECVEAPRPRQIGEIDLFTVAGIYEARCGVPMAQASKERRYAA